MLHASRPLLLWTFLGALEQNCWRRWVMSWQKWRKLSVPSSSVDRLGTPLLTAASHWCLPHQRTFPSFHHYSIWSFAYRSVAPLSRPVMIGHPVIKAQLCALALSLYKPGRRSCSWHIINPSRSTINKSYSHSLQQIFQGRHCSLITCLIFPTNFAQAQHKGLYNPQPPQ